MIELTGLWINKDKNGNTYLSGNLSFSTKLLIFKNNYKRNEKDPDYKIYLAEKKDQQQEIKEPEKEADILDNEPF